MPAHRNALADQPSPYLQQHADNPVDWQPWNDAALERARHEDKPILLSIGYSSCHWCHVMAHESFEDEATAEVLNRLFVNVKVDREERPDLDKIYQVAHQLMHQRGGGWPLTVFLDPEDRMPFFTGTYFPSTPRHGLPSFVQLCERVAQVYREQRDAIREQSASIAEVLERVERGPGPREGDLDGQPIAAAREELARAFDARRGGFGGAPKFPQATLLKALLGPCRADGGAGMALTTLRRMALGGIHDQVGGGFCRYSVDGEWMIPHFEKMLYDNAQLLPLYADASRRTAEPLFRDAADGIVRWLEREMRCPQGGWYSALDADSEGEEGKYYVWTRDELKALLEPDDYAAAEQMFRLDGEPNFEGKFHLHRYDDGGADHAFVERIRAALLPEREKRVPPGRDDKVLTGWNALLAGGLAKAGRLLGVPAWIDLAAETFDFLRDVQWRDDRLHAACKDGVPYLDGYLDDYAFALDAALELLQARWRRADLDFAIALADALLERFADREQGGFFFTAHDHETLITRPKPFGDDATPAGNAIAAQALGRLGHLLGEAKYLDAVERTLRAAGAMLDQAPSAHSGLLTPLAEHLDPPPQAIVRQAEPETTWLWEPLAAAAFQGTIYAIPIGEQALPGALEGMTARGELTAYVCRGTACSAPVEDPRALQERLLEDDRAGR